MYVSVFTCIVVLCPKKYQFWSQSCGFWSHSSRLWQSPLESSHSCRSQWGTEKYWLKQASWVWNELLNTELGKLGFKQITVDYCIYVYCTGKEICFLAVYVDDMGMLTNNLHFMEKLKMVIGEVFKIKDLGPIKQLLGVAIDYDQKTGCLELSQSCYIQQSLERYGCDDGCTHPTPLSSSVKLTKA